MATPRSLVALRCEFDQAVIRSDRDPSVEAIAELFFPGSTGDSVGWSESLRSVVNGDINESFPGVEEALAEIVENPDLSIPQLARLVYLVGALTHLPHLAPIVEERDGLFARALALAGPAGIRTEVAVGYELVQFLGANLASRQLWQEVAFEAVARQLLSAEVASVPLCNAYPIMEGTVLCVQIETDFEHPGIYLQNLKDVVDPLNWNRNQPKLFCEMTKQNPEHNPVDNWSRVLETVSLDCPLGLPRIKTALKYRKRDIGASRALLEFNLDDYQGPILGDGQVVVDKGYIDMWATGNPGVRVKSVKKAYVKNWHPVAVSAWICEAGYGTQAMEMLFGNADKPPKNTVPWKPSPPPPLPPPSPSTGTVTTTGGVNTLPQKGFASITVEMWMDCIQKAMDETSQLSTKWVKSELKLQDLVETSQMAGARLASAPWRYIKALSEVPMPSTLTENDATQGGGK